MRNPGLPADIPPAQALVRLQFDACTALGYLKGLLRQLDQNSAFFFAFRIVRLTILQALTVSAYSQAHHSFENWVTQAENPPPLSSIHPAPAHRIIAFILSELRVSSWPPLAVAAETMKLAIPHLLRPVDGIGGDAPALPHQDDLAVAMESLAHHCAAMEQVGTDRHPVERLWHLIEGAGALPVFQRDRPGHRLIDTPSGTRPVELSAPQTPVWMLDLAMGKIMASLQFLSFPLPLPGAVTQQALSWEHPSHARELAFFSNLTRAAGVLRAALHGALADGQAFASLAAPFRSNSRAPLAFALLCGLGAARLKQVQQGLAVSRLGAVAMLNGLKEAGLVERNQQKIWVPAAERTEERNKLEAPLANMRQIDRHMAELDALLSRLGGKDNAGC